MIFRKILVPLQSTLMMKVHNSQVAGSLNINKYNFDVSENNGTNVNSQTIEKVLNKLANSTNIDVSLNDLSANTLYDLSVNMFNSQDLSSNKTAESGVTRPSEFTTNDVSQNMTSDVVTTDSITMSAKHKDVAGTLDISGYKLTYEVTGGNTDTGSLQVTATNKMPNASNNDISINSLNYPNANYTITTHLFNVHDMSNATVSRTAYTRPSDFVTSDITQNTGTTTTTSLVLNVNNSQDANTLDIKNYVIDYKGNDNVTTQDSNVTLTPTTKTSNATNNDVTVTGLLPNVTYDLSAHLINDVDLSNSKIGLSATTRPTTFVDNDISQNIGSTTQSTLMMKVHNSQVAGSLNINKYSFDISGNNGTNATSQTVEKTASNKGPTDTNNSVALTD